MKSSEIACNRPSLRSEWVRGVVLLQGYEVAPACWMESLQLNRVICCWLRELGLGLYTGGSCTCKFCLRRLRNASNSKHVPPNENLARLSIIKRGFAICAIKINVNYKFAYLLEFRGRAGPGPPLLPSSTSPGQGMSRTSRTDRPDDRTRSRTISARALTNGR